MNGIPFIKHCSDGRKRERVLTLNAAATRVGWKKQQREHTMIPLDSVTSVRSAMEVDPTTVGNSKRPEGMGGTDILRRSADGPAVMKRAFSLILEDRSLDIECASELEARTLCSAFKVMVRQIKQK